MVRPLRLRPRRPRAFARFPTLERTLEHLQPDVVHVVGEPWQLGTVLALQAGRRVGAHVGVHFAENGPALRGLGGRLRHLAARASLAAVDYAVGWSKGAADLAKGIWRLNGPVRVVPSVGIPAAFFEATRASPERRQDRVAFVGRLSPEKGIHDLLELAHRLAGDGIGCVIVGDGPLRPMVEAATRKRLVEYLGPLPRPQVAQVMAGAAITVVPSHPGVIAGPLGFKTHCEEQFGLVIAESLATGTPVVGYRLGAIPDVVGPGGLVVPLGDVAAMATAVQRLLGEKALWRAAAEQGRHWAGQFADQRIADELLGLWAELE